MTAEQQREQRRRQLALDFPLVCDSFGFDAAYRRLIWGWLERNDRAAKCYRQIAYSLRGII
jgi:hypothetical protein